MENAPSISYDIVTLTEIMQKIHDLIVEHQHHFDTSVTQGPLSLFHMADVLSHLPEPQLHAFPYHISQWKNALDQHINVLADLTQLLQHGIHDIQGSDTEYGQNTRS